MKPKFQCCNVDTVCGRNLWHGVVIAGLSTLVISTVVLATSIGFLSSIAGIDQSYNSQPMVAVNLVFALVSTSISCYQIVISLLLLYHTYRLKNKVYLCSLWYVSHLSILTLYCLLFSSKVVVCCYEKLYGAAVGTIVIGVFYQALYTYFSIVVNSYLHSLDEDRYF